MQTESHGVYFVSAHELEEHAQQEECRLLGCKTRVRTSQETHYVSATQPSLLLLCKIWSFHGGDYENAVFWDVPP
jgi:hypothetical protein